MATQTIRRNSIAKIRALLEQAVLIRRYYDDGQDCQTDRATAEQILALAERFRRVTLSDDGLLQIEIHMNHFYSIYLSHAAARRNLTAQAIAKYFPDQAVAAADQGAR